MTLARYLSNIAQGKPINYESFLKCLPSDISSRHTRYFNIRKVSAQRWVVACEEPGLLEKLKIPARQPDGRVAAALQGNSHQRAAEADLLLVYHSSLVDIRPGVVYLTAEETVQDFERKPAVLLIENQQNFLQSGEMLRLASGFCDRQFTLDNTDVAFGGGSRINSSRLASWLSHYEAVVCAFDFDLGGLRMFKALQARLGTRAVFLQPPDWTPFHSFFVNPPRTTQRFLQAIDLAGQLGFSGLADIMLQTGHFMEQESLLAQSVAFD